MMLNLSGIVILGLGLGLRLCLDLLSMYHSLIGLEAGLKTIIHSMKGRERQLGPAPATARRKDNEGRLDRRES
jgi:hypothetical protein